MCSISANVSQERKRIQEMLLFILQLELISSPAVWSERRTRFPPQPHRSTASTSLNDHALPASASQIINKS